MKKEELKELIEGIIVPNGQKGISADMLKSVLLEVADSLGEGGEGGSAGYTFFVNCDMGQAEGAGTAEEALELTNRLTPAELEYNRTMFAKIEEDVNNGKPMPIININFPMNFVEPTIEIEEYVSQVATMSMYIPNEDVLEMIGLPIDLAPVIIAEVYNGMLIIHPQGYGIIMGM
jgi:hypothetical protein